MASNNVIPFRGSVGNSTAVSSGATGEGDHGFDHGPTPEESLRLMRAFAGIKNKLLRADLISMLGRRARARAAEPARGRE